MIGGPRRLAMPIPMKPTPVRALVMKASVSNLGELSYGYDPPDLVNIPSRRGESWGHL